MSNIAIIGASGLVGQTFIELLNKRNIPIDNLYLFGSRRSAGTCINVRGRNYVIEPLQGTIPPRIDIAFFSAGSEISKAYIPLFAAANAVCIDNSSVFRMDEHIPLIVPQINGELIKPEHRIIANPNCSTIQLVLVLHTLRDLHEFSRVDVVSCQSVSGAGRTALNTLKEERQNPDSNTIYCNNVIQSIGSLQKDGYCFEEIKIINETRKILASDTLQVNATTFRVPVEFGHTESVSIHFKAPVDIDRAIETLQNTSLPITFNNEVTNSMAAHTDNVFVSRVRRDLADSRIMHLTVTADNIHIGAATNAVNIAEEII